MADTDRTQLSLRVAVTLAVLTLACGDSSDTKKAAAPATAPSQGATASQVNPLPRDQVKDGGKLVWPMDQMPVQYNYNQVDGTEATVAYLWSATMPRVFLLEADGTPRWNPDLLASDPAVVTDPTQIITFSINPKARWSDGKPITWDDFDWQWKALNGTNKAYQIAAANGYEDIASVAKGKDDREVVVTFKHHYADWKALFDPLYPVAVNKSPQVFNEGLKNGPLVTAGPFKFGPIDRTAKTVTLVRDDKFWGDPAKLDTIVFRAIDTNAWIDALANGEIDLMDIGSDANMFNRAKGIGGVEIRTAGGPNFRHITINGTGAILKDVNVRQAIAMSINRGALARAMLGPLGMEPKTLGNHVFMSNQKGYQDNSGAVGQYNPDKAKQILEQSGWKLDGNVRRKNGQPLEIRCVIPSAVAVSKQESELVQNMLAQVGVTMKIDTVPSPDFFSKYIRPGQFDLTFFSWIGTPYPISAVRSIYVNPKPGPDGQLAVEQNYGRIGSDEIDRLFSQATQELDGQKAIGLANQLDALIWQEVHSLTLYQRPEIWGVKKDLANMGALGMANPEPAFQNIGWARH
jgi:glutathione transport system substrate-binding protein